MSATGIVVARAVRAEWTRLWSVRSTWLSTLVATVGIVAVSLLVGADARGENQTEPGETVWVAVQILGLLAMLVLLALAASCTTADHATGGIVPTLQWTPRRGVLLVARTGVIATTVTGIGLLVALLAAVVINQMAPVLGIRDPAATQTLAALGYVYLLGSLVAVGLGLLLRSTAGAIVAVLALMLVLPLLLGNLPFDWARDIATVLPGSSAIKLVVGEGLPGLGTVQARITLAVWAVGTLAAGAGRLMRSDADR